MNKYGFSLIETMIYCCISALLGVLVCQFFVNSYANFQHTQHTGQQLMALYATHDLLVRDLEMASASLRDWYMQEGSGFVCLLSDESVGWEYKNGKLYRATGTYDFAQKIWHKKSQALIAQDVAIFDCQIKNGDRSAQAVVINLSIGQSEPIAAIVNLFNRRVM